MLRPLTTSLLSLLFCLPALSWAEEKTICFVDVREETRRTREFTARVNFTLAKTVYPAATASDNGTMLKPDQGRVEFYQAHRGREQLKRILVILGRPSDNGSYFATYQIFKPRPGCTGPTKKTKRCATWSPGKLNADYQLGTSDDEALQKVLNIITECSG